MKMFVLLMISLGLVVSCGLFENGTKYDPSIELGKKIQYALQKYLLNHKDLSDSLSGTFNKVYFDDEYKLWIGSWVYIEKDKKLRLSHVIDQLNMILEYEALIEINSNDEVSIINIFETEERTE